MQSTMKDSKVVRIPAYRMLAVEPEKKLHVAYTVNKIDVFHDISVTTIRHDVAK